MNEFSIIDHYFKYLAPFHKDLILGIGDDAACIKVPQGQDLLVTTDTLVAGVHFLAEWDPFDIAYRAVATNLSDIAAMGGKAAWMSLALTLDDPNPEWLDKFTKGIKSILNTHAVALIGGDLTRGPLTITITMQGLVPEGKAIRRSGAKPGDYIYVSGPLGGAALAVLDLKEPFLETKDKASVMKKLQRPQPRLDLAPFLQEYASAAIDISDGLSADLFHICKNSEVGACLLEEKIPVHPALHQYPFKVKKPLNVVMQGGDDYELCFTIPEEKKSDFESALQEHKIHCYGIGRIEKKSGLRMELQDKTIIQCNISGYSHF